MPAGRWTTYGDLAQLIGTAPQPLGRHLAICTERSPAHRVLAYDGTIPPGFRWTDPNDRRKPEDVLRSEGVSFPHGRADAGRRLTAADLKALVDAGV